MNLVMVLAMLLVRHDFKVLNPVVMLFTIDVMNYFIFRQFPSKMLLHKNPVKNTLLSFTFCPSVLSIAILMSCVAFLRAVLLLLPLPISKA